MQELFSEKNFARLSEEVINLIKKQDWMQKYGFEWAILFFRIIGFCLGFYIFTNTVTNTGIFYKVLGMIVLSYFYYGIAITGIHETSHRSFVRSSKLNKFFGYIFSDFWASQSSEWWYHRHIEVHHIYTNIKSKENENSFYYPWIGRYVYFFLIPYLAVFWEIIYSIDFLWEKWKNLVLYLLLVTAGWAFHLFLFSLILPFHLAFLSVFIMRSLFAPLFVHLAVFNHIGLEDPKVRLPWIEHQTLTTRNLKRNWFLSGLGGNAFVEAHIEHHLFPSLSNKMLLKIRPIVLKYLKKEGYTYVEETYFNCLKNCIKYYHKIFSNAPVAL